MKVISIKERRYGDFETCLRRININTGLWEWDNMGFFKESYSKRKGMSSEEWAKPRTPSESINPFALNVEYNTLEKDGLKSYIEAFQKILRLEVSENYHELEIDWLNNEAQFRLKARKVSNAEIILKIGCIHKYRTDYQKHDLRGYGGIDYGIAEHQSYHGKPDEYGFISINFTIEAILDYINELINEYEEVTGEKYIKINSQNNET